MSLLRPLLTNPMFWTLMLMSLILTMIREMFNAWLPTYLKNVIKMDDSEAAYASAVRPLQLSMLGGGGGWAKARAGTRVCTRLNARPPTAPRLPAHSSEYCTAHASEHCPAPVCVCVDACSRSSQSSAVPVCGHHLGHPWRLPG